jgi:hypothetical protein
MRTETHPDGRRWPVGPIHLAYTLAYDNISPRTAKNLQIHLADDFSQNMPHPIVM